MSEVRLEVIIDGVKYPLVSKEPKENLEKIADYVDKNIQDVKSDKLTFDKELILACLNIADEYYRNKEDFLAYKDKNQEAIQNYPDLKKDFENFKKEYEPYKEKFSKIESELKSAKSILRDKDSEILALKDAKEHVKRLRTKLEDQSKKIMDLTKENETLKGNI